MDGALGATTGREGGLAAGDEDAAMKANADVAAGGDALTTVSGGVTGAGALTAPTATGAAPGAIPPLRKPKADPSDGGADGEDSGDGSGASSGSWELAAMKLKADTGTGAGPGSGSLLLRGESKPGMSSAAGACVDPITGDVCMNPRSVMVLTGGGA
jgi:hypothetical protein